MGVAIVGFGFADALWLALVCLAVAGAMDSISGLFRSTIWNSTIPAHLRGRLAGIEMLSWSSGPTLGGAEAGAVAALAGLRAAVVSGGVLCVAGTAVLVALLPRFWSYDARLPVEGGRRRAWPRARAAVIRTRRACAQCSTVRNARRSRTAVTYDTGDEATQTS